MKRSGENIKSGEVIPLTKGVLAIVQGLLDATLQLFYKDLKVSNLSKNTKYWRDKWKRILQLLIILIRMKIENLSNIYLS